MIIIAKKRSTFHKPFNLPHENANLMLHLHLLLFFVAAFFLSPFYLLLTFKVHVLLTIITTTIVQQTDNNGENLDKRLCSFSLHFTKARG